MPDSIASDLIHATQIHSSLIAFSDQDLTITYGELHGFAAWLQPRLASRKPVAVYGRPCAVFGAAAAASVTLGRPFVHLDPAMPPAVLHNIVFELGVEQVILCQPPAAGHDLPGCGRIEPVSILCAPDACAGSHGGLMPPVLSRDDPIFIVATSGTTGRPKCIPVTYGAARLSYQWRDTLLPYQAGQRVGAYIFAIWEMFRPLRHGAQVCFPAVNDLMKPDALFAFISRNNLTEILFTPSFLAKALDGLSPRARVLGAPRRILLNG